MATRGRAAARRRRIVYEISKRFCKSVIVASTERASIQIIKTRIQRWLRSIWSIHQARRAFLQAKQAAEEEEQSLAAARQIQSHYRLCLKAKQIRRREHERRELASTIITSMVRRKLSVSYVNKLKQDRVYERNCSNAIILQCFTRASLAKTHLRRRKERARLVERAVAVLKRFAKEIAAKQAKRRKVQDNHAVIIQKQILAYSNCRKYARMKLAAVRIQKFIRGDQTRKVFLANKQSNNIDAEDTVDLATCEQRPLTSSPADIGETNDNGGDECQDVLMCSDDYNQLLGVCLDEDVYSTNDNAKHEW